MKQASIPVQRGARAVFKFYSFVPRKFWRNSMGETEMPNSYLKPKEAARFVGRSVRTLARMRAEGRGPAYHREGKCILYPLDALKAWLDKHIVVPSKSTAVRASSPVRIAAAARSVPDCRALMVDHDHIEGGLCSTPLQKYGGNG